MIAAKEPRTEPKPEEPRDLIDTSKMSSGQRAALELTEAARETSREGTFASKLFMGDFDLAGIRPYPLQSTEDRDQGDAFLQQLEKLLREKINPDEIDTTGEIPRPVMDALAKLGAFGIKISPDYGGLGLSQTNHYRAPALLGGLLRPLTALLYAHQSIRPPPPPLTFG